MKNLLFRIKTTFEHQLKNLGLFTGFAIAVLALIIWFSEAYVFKNLDVLSKENTDKLFGLNTAMASLLIAILTTSFSVVFVVMQLASSQFSPRILRYFIYNDVKIQQFIGLLIGTLAFTFVPQVASVVTDNTDKTLALCSLFAIFLHFYCLLISFPRLITHLNDNMNVASITHRIKNEVLQEIDALYIQDWQLGDHLLYKTPQRDAEKSAVTLRWKGQSGYISTINYERLSLFCNDFLKKNPSISVSRFFQKTLIGEFVMANATPIMTIELNEKIATETEKMIISLFETEIQHIFSINKYRSNTQDINFGVRKLVDIAIKAISPAVNDPTTCLNCIDYLGEIINTMAVKKMPSTAAVQLKSEKVFINEFGFDELVDFCFDQIFQWGKNDPVVMKRVVKTLQHIVPNVQNPYNLAVLIRQIEAMELHRFYDVKNENRMHSLEQIQSVERELKKFEQKAISQIQYIDNQGFMSLNKIEKPTKQEQEAINYLRIYVS